MWGLQAGNRFLSHSVGKEKMVVMTKDPSWVGGVASVKTMPNDAFSESRKLDTIKNVCNFVMIAKSDRDITREDIETFARTPLHYVRKRNELPFTCELQSGHFLFSFNHDTLILYVSGSHVKPNMFSLPEHFDVTWHVLHKGGVADTSKFNLLRGMQEFGQALYGNLSIEISEVSPLFLPKWDEGEDCMTDWLAKDSTTLWRDRLMRANYAFAMAQQEYMKEWKNHVDPYVYHMMTTYKVGSKEFVEQLLDAKGHLFSLQSTAGHKVFNRNNDHFLKYAYEVKGVAYTSGKLYWYNLEEYLEEHRLCKAPFLIGDADAFKSTLLEALARELLKREQHRDGTNQFYYKGKSIDEHGSYNKAGLTKSIGFYQFDDFDLVSLKDNDSLSDQEIKSFFRVQEAASVKARYGKAHFLPRVPMMFTQNANKNKETGKYDWFSWFGKHQSKVLKDTGMPCDIFEGVRIMLEAEEGKADEAAEKINAMNGDQQAVCKALILFKITEPLVYKEGDNNDNWVEMQERLAARRGGAYKL